MPLPIKILAADDNQEALASLVDLLKQQGYEVLPAPSGDETLSIITNSTKDSLPDILLLDVQMPPGPDGFEITKRLKSDERYRYIPIILLTAKDDMEDITYGFECGANDYIKKPFKAPELVSRIAAALHTKKIYTELQDVVLDNAKLRQASNNKFSTNSIIGESDSILEIFRIIETVRDAKAPVLITGESGTGKELVARAIHYASSSRKDNPFIAVNCAAFNENLLESELFGHVKGAFTGAIRDKIGLFQAANNGTLFLDELGEMPVSLQVKLLRVLQDGSFIPVGDTRSKSVDVRVIAATNRDLKKMILTGSFREDLYYRLNVVGIEIPPLRDRVSDIPLLADLFLKEAVKRNNFNNNEKRLSSKVISLLVQYGWPGNVRQLQNEVEKLVIMSGKDNEDKEISEQYLSKEIKELDKDFKKDTDNNKKIGNKDTVCEEEDPQGDAAHERASGKLKDALENLERSLILAALERSRGNKSEAARELGISRSNLIAKVAGWGA